MIEIRKEGNLFECNTQAIVNTVNCVGIMGAGIAQQFKTRFPDMFNNYARLCKAGKIRPGKVWLWHAMRNPIKVGDIPCCHTNECFYIVNFPTKDHWYNPSQMQWIQDGLD